MTSDPKQNPKGRSFETTLRIGAPRDAVWAAIASDAGLRRWFAPEASIDPRVGGEVVWTWSEQIRWPQRIEIVEPGVRLKTRYDSSVDDGEGGKRPLWVDFMLEGDGGTTTLRLVHSGFGAEADFDEEYDGISSGWPVELSSLALSLECHPGQDRQLVRVTVPVTEDPTDAWQRLTGKDGFDCGPDLGSLPTGSSLEFTSPDGDRYAGEILVGAPRHFAAKLHNQGDAFFRLAVENCGGSTMAWAWLGAYGQDPDRLAAMQSRWETRMTQLFANDGAHTA